MVRKPTEISWQTSTLGVPEEKRQHKYCGTRLSPIIYCIQIIAFNAAMPSSFENKKKFRKQKRKNSAIVRVLQVSTTKEREDMEKLLPGSAKYVATPQRQNCLSIAMVADTKHTRANFR